MGAVLGAFGVVALASSCNLPVTASTTYTNHVFRILATSGYTGSYVTQAATTAISGSGDQSFTITATPGQTYTLTVSKNADDGTPLTAEIIANQTVDGLSTSVIVDSDTTTTQNSPATVVLVD